MHTHLGVATGNVLVFVVAPYALCMRTVPNFVLAAARERSRACMESGLHEGLELKYFPFTHGTFP